MSQLMRLYERLRDQLGLGGDVTEFANLHPNDQETGARAFDTLEHLTNLGYWEHLTTIGLASPADVEQYFWTAKGVNQEANQEALGLDMPMVVRWLVTDDGTSQGKSWRVHESQEGYLLITVASSSSARTAVVLARVKKARTGGWHTWEGATAVVVSICDNMEEATEYIERAVYARQDLYNLQSRSREIARNEATATPTRGTVADF